jgi:hypothetical protein
LDFLNVRHYVDRHSDQGLMGAALTPVKMGDLDLYRSETTWPRAFFSSEIQRYQTVQELGEKVRQGHGQPFAAVQNDELVREPALANFASKESTPGTIQKAHDYQLTTNKTAFTIDASGPGVAVLHEAYLNRSFKVTLNGEPVPYFRVNHAFKGVMIPAAGSYRIEFAFWPRRLTTALVMSGIGAALCVLTGLVAWRVRPSLAMSASAV